MRLAFPTALWLLALAPLLWGAAVLEARRRRQRLEILGQSRALRALASPAQLRPRLWSRGALSVAYACVVVALAGPQFGQRSELLPRRGLDVVFAVDVSASMRARDVAPDRLERVKAEIDAALPRFGENRLALVPFAGTAFVSCPLTSDVEAFRVFLRALDPTSVPQGGTSLALGATVALRLFEAEAEGATEAPAGRVLVILTDGEDHEGALAPVAKQLRQAGVQTLVIGVGSALGEPIPVVEDGRVTGYKKDRQGRTVMTRLSPDVLQGFADEAGGRFFDGTSRTDLALSEVEAAVAALEKRDLEARVRVRYVDRSGWPLGAGLLLIGLALWLGDGRRRRAPAVAGGLS